MAVGGGEKGASKIFGKLTGSAAKDTTPSTQNKADTVFMVRQTTSSNRASKHKHRTSTPKILSLPNLCLFRSKAG